MLRKAVIAAGSLSAMLCVLATPVIADEMKNNGQSEALRLMDQSREYAQQQNQYRNYSTTDSSRQMSQDKTRNMYNADNDTGRGEMKRERNRQRDGTGSASQNKYGQ